MGTILQEDKTILNRYALRHEGSDTPLSFIGRSSRQKIIKTQEYYADPQYPVDLRAQIQH